jgi:cysteine-rich repeat protein
MVLAADQTERVSAAGVVLSTAGANCATGPANGGIWAVTASDAGTLRLNAVPQRDASGSPADAVISVRSDCAKATTTRACSRSGPGEVERLALPIAAGETLYVLVQSAAPFELFATLESARCGDGVLNASEQCDFGDTVSGDGCDAACQYETPASSDVCPGEVMSVSRGQTLILDRHTVGYGDEYDAPCGARVGGPDRVFGVNPTTSGTLRATLSSTFDGVLSVHASCLAPRVGALLACSDGPRADDIEAISTPVTGGLQYFVVVDGYRAESFGPFELTIELE